MADYDPYSAAPPRGVPRRPDPFRVMSREVFPRKGDPRRRDPDLAPIRPRAHTRPPERPLAPAGTPSDERGVFEEEAPFAGLRRFAVFADDRERIADVTAVEGIVDEAFLAGLERLLERYRPRPTLRAI